MKRWFVDEDNLYSKIQTGNQLQVVLASDVDRLRADRRSDIMLLIVQWLDKTAPRREVGELADRILSAIFGEDKHD